MVHPSIFNIQVLLVFIGFIRFFFRFVDKKHKKKKHEDMKNNVMGFFMWSLYILGSK